MSPDAAPGAPDVSVIMPCLNGLPYLREAVQGVLAQRVPLELLFVDGGSTDGSREWVDSLRHPSVRILDVSRGTPPGAARNLGAREARGRWLAFADADDVWTGDKLRRQLEALKGSDARLSYSDCTVVDASGHGLGSFQSRHHARSGDVFRALLEGNFVPLSTVLVDRRALLSAGGFPDGLIVASDYLLLLRLARRIPFLFVPDELVRYRIHPGNLTADFRLAYSENLELLDRLEADAALTDQDRAHVRRAGALICWRWAVVEVMEEPSDWREVRRLARLAVERAGGLGPGLSALLTVARGAGQGVRLRLKMRGARRGTRS